MTAGAELDRHPAADQADVLSTGPAVTAHTAAPTTKTPEERPAEILAAYNKALSPPFGALRDPGRRATPRQIAGDVLQSLWELTEVIPELRGYCDAVREAYLLGKPIPKLDPARCDDWPEIEAAAQSAGAVRDALRTGATVAAGMAAAQAVYWCCAAEERLWPEWEGQRKQAEAKNRIASGQKKGAEENRVKWEAVRQKAMEIHRSEGPWTKDDAAAEIALRLPIKPGTAREYLRGVTWVATSQKS